MSSVVNTSSPHSDYRDIYKGTPDGKNNGESDSELKKKKEEQGPGLSWGSGVFPALPFRQQHQEEYHPAMFSVLASLHLRVTSSTGPPSAQLGKQSLNS